MKSQTITSALGGLMMLVCGVAGFIDAFVLGGLGICGGLPLTWGNFGFSAFTALLPAGTVGIFRGPWWSAAVVFSGPLLMAVFGGALAGEWYRSLASIVCVAFAFGGAWLFKPCSKA